ncbi:MAG TPA: helix-turn-helix transcriptional regulator [Brevibacillus sp.]|nr:helix-turn-helix transcriptional regulator [Brevibacillus sp.]
MRREALKKARLNRNLSQASAAQALHISEIYLRKLEAGTRNPSRALSKQLAKFYDKSEEELFPDLF